MMYVVQQQLQGVDGTDRFTDTALDFINSRGEIFGGNGPQLFLLQFLIKVA